MSTIYLVSYYFAPLGRADGVNRTYLVKSIANYGWKFQVITGIEYRSLILNFQKDHSLLEALPSSVEIQRFKSDKEWLSHDIKQLLKSKENIRTHWIYEAEQKFSYKEKGIFMAVAPPVDNAILAYNLAMKYNAPLVLYYPDDVYDVPNHIVKKAKVIFAVTARIKELLEKHYHHPNIIVAEQGYPEKMECPQKTSVGIPIKMIFAGSLNFNTRPELFAKAYQELRKSDGALADQLTVDFYGPSGYYSWLFLRPYLNNNIQFKGYLPFKELMKLLPQYDIALAISQAGFASKSFQYFNAGLPMFCVTERSDFGNFIKKNNIGLVSNFQIDMIKNNLRELILHKNKILEWRENVLKIRDNFSMQSKTGIIDKTLKEISP